MAVRNRFIRICIIFHAHQCQVPLYFKNGVIGADVASFFFICNFFGNLDTTRRTFIEPAEYFAMVIFSNILINRYPLYIQGTREVRYVIPENSSKKETFYYRVRLPPYLTCSQCVLQWTYYTGNGYLPSTVDSTNDQIFVCIKF